MDKIDLKIEITRQKANINATIEVMDILLTHITKLEKQIKFYMQTLETLQIEEAEKCMNISA